MKIRGIEPGPPGTHVFSKLNFPRLGLSIIMAVLKNHGHDVLIYCPDLAPIDWDDVESSDLVGISSTTSTITEAYANADRLHKKGIPVVMGGAHVTFMADEALGHADFVARGEGGERIMLELTKVINGQGSYDAIDGLSYKRNGKAFHNPMGKRTESLDDLPFPDLTLIHGYEKISSTPIMTSWGCPFNCNFCSVTAMFGKKYRFRSPENVIAELKQKKPTSVFFYDDNLAANKKRLKVLLKMIIDEGLTFRWSAQTRTDIVKDPELLNLMVRSGCWQVYLGLESVNQQTLDDYDKDQTVEDVKEAVKELNRRGIKTHGMFVVGSDNDPRSCVKDTVSFALKYGISTIMLNILTPLPGTDTYAELERSGRIMKPPRWEHFDAHHVVFEPKGMTPYELQREVIAGYVRFYAWRQVLKAILTMDKVKIILSLWGYSTVRSWRKDVANKDYVRRLRGWKRGTR